MKFYDLDEPDYREMNHNHWYKLPLYLEWVMFMQKRHYKKLMLQLKTLLPTPVILMEIKIKITYPLTQMLLII